MAERNARKVAAPADGYGDSTEDSGNLVTQHFPQIEAFEGVFPHTVT